MMTEPLDPSSVTGGKLVIYRQLQQEPLPPSYVLANMTVKRCRTTAAIREGCLPLAVERGHFHVPKIPLKVRLCFFCNKNSMEYVPYFALSCSVQSTIIPFIIPFWVFLILFNCVNSMLVISSMNPSSDVIGS